jgi:hypothetical protein
MAAKYRTLREFWPFYLHEHSRRGTRALHLIGTAVALACIVLAILLTPWFLLGGLVAGYAFARRPSPTRSSPSPPTG